MAATVTEKKHFIMYLPRTADGGSCGSPHRFRRAISYLYARLPAGAMQDAFLTKADVNKMIEGAGLII